MNGMSHTIWLIWDKFCVSAPSDTETASQVQATDHEIGDEEIQCDLDSYPTGNLPTHDEALKLENLSNTELRRRVSAINKKRWLQSSSRLWLRRMSRLFTLNIFLK